MNEIFRLNPGSEDIIRTGEILLIPEKDSIAKLDTSGEYQSYLVSKGETKYGISKAFGISITELEKANPFIRSGLQSGHNLKIPIKKNSSTVNKNTHQHVVVKGETLWGISKKHNIPLDDLIDLNQDILGEFLQIGQVLSLSDNDTQSLISKTYTIQKGDTKYGISKRFNISISELEHLNPEITDILNIGTVIQLENTTEGNITEKDVPIITNAIDKVKTFDTLNLYIIKPKETLYSLAKKSGLSQDELISLNPKLETSVLAGDTIRFSKNTEQKNIIDDEFLPSINKRIITEIYWKEDSIASQEKYINNTKDYLSGLRQVATTSEAKHPEIALNLIHLKQTDSLFQTYNPDSLSHFKIKPIPNFNIENDPRELSSFIITQVDNNSNESLTVKGMPGEEEMRLKMIQFLNSKKGKVICLYDTNHSDYTKSLKKMIPNIEFIKLNRNDQFKTKDLEEILDSEQKNFVIIESAKVGVFLSASSTLLKQSSIQDIQLVVLNPKNIPDNTRISYNRFKILNLTYPMSYNPNYLKENSLDYKMAYLICSDILNRLKVKGLESFKNQTSTSVLGTEFKYEFSNNIVENKAVSIYMFNDDSDAYLIGTY